MSSLNFYELDLEKQKTLLEIRFPKRGKCIEETGGLCGQIFIFDQGINVLPRFVCAKIAKPLRYEKKEETSKRFLQELEAQLSFYQNMYVHWITDVDTAYDIPIAWFRYWDSDLLTVIKDNKSNITTKLSMLTYLCAGLEHCYSQGLVAHQDLKPANIFIRNLSKSFRDLPNFNIYEIAMVADFGLANAFQRLKLFDGAKPYKSPEQWSEKQLTSKSDVFSLGVIFYELLSGGYHPVGIKLYEHWPEPMRDNSKKWTRDDVWKKWIKQGALINHKNSDINDELGELISKMLSIDVQVRPTIDQVLNSLLLEVEKLNQDSYEQLIFQLDYFKSESCNTGLEKKWPYLNKKWENLKLKHSKTT
ncbi:MULTISPECIES: protein kinase domain-containing protein [Psychrobacter]|uniref:protein kinase domain-containing protein n=1 Tax=Psychrobacter TaxID=497 RepID=UPI0012FF2699|nr:MULTISPECIES: protein kinase [Psychrobacter]